MACALVAAAISVGGAEASSLDEVLVTEVAPGAVISNGTVSLGVNNLGQLNFSNTGVMYVATGNDGTRAGCQCEGWGAGAVIDSVEGQDVTFQGRANNSAGIDGVSLAGFEATETEAISAVAVLNGETPALGVVHEFVPSPQSPNLYEIAVTLVNLTDGTLTDVRYAREMDWDVEPTPFSEFVTINRGDPAPSALIYSDDDGFADNYPFTDDGPANPATVNANYEDLGPTDHGARFIFSFGDLAPEEEVTFFLYYGAAGTEDDADAAVSSAALEVFSYGQPSGEGGASEGVPNTFIWGFRAVGGTALIPPTLALTPETATGPVGESHTVTADLRDSSEEPQPVPGAPLVFEVTGANQASGFATTGEDGRASFTYTGTNGGTDSIRACLDSDGSGSCGETEVTDTAEKIWGGGAEPSGSADVGVTISASADTVDPGQQVSYGVTVTNSGPFRAPGTNVTVHLPANFSFASVSTSKGTCSGGTPTTCSLDTLEVGESASIGVVGTAAAPGPGTAQADVSSAAADPNVGANNSATVGVTVTGEEDEGEQPPPEPGEGNATPLRGTVTINGREVEGEVRLQNGDTVDTTEGTIEVETVNGTAQFAGGEFRYFDLTSAASVLRRASAGTEELGVTEIRLTGGDFRRTCATGSRKLSVNGAEPPRKKKKTKVRSLWGNADGSFRTRGRHSSATIRGTVWFTADRCDGTLTFVREGSVLVEDFRLKRTRIIKAGQRYLAQPQAKSKAKSKRR